MLKSKYQVLFLLMLVLGACGPETIFVRPSLDTPDRHVANGQALLVQGKYTDALREFKYANELDPKNLDAQIGMALSLGYCGNHDQGRAALDKAEKLAGSPQDREKIADTRNQLQKLRDGQ